MVLLQTILNSLDGLKISRVIYVSYFFNISWKLPKRLKIIFISLGKYMLSSVLKIHENFSPFEICLIPVEVPYIISRLPLEIYWLVVISNKCKGHRVKTDMFWTAMFLFCPRCHFSFWKTACCYLISQRILSIFHTQALYLHFYNDVIIRILFCTSVVDWK